MSDGDEHVRLLGFDALWQSTLTDDSNLESALQRVAETGCGLLSNCMGSSVTLIERGRPITVGSTNETARVLDDAQYASGQGPCLAAAHERRAVRIDDTANDERWPKFSASARARGVASSLSLPLNLSGRETAGGFNVYGEVIGGFTEDDEQLCETFAAHASIVVSNAEAYWAAFDLSNNLAKAMESRSVIEQAKGVLIAINRVDADQAFELLRQRSQSSNRKLRDVAADVLEDARREGDV